MSAALRRSTDGSWRSPELGISHIIRFLSLREIYREDEQGSEEKQPIPSNLIEKWKAVPCQSALTVALVVKRASQSYLSPCSTPESLLLSTLCPPSRHLIASAVSWLLILLSRCESAPATLHQMPSLILDTHQMPSLILAAQAVYLPSQPPR